jgi:hypothetical protein
MSAQGLISPEYQDTQGNRVMVIMNDDGAAILMARPAGGEWEYAGEGTWEAETPAQCRSEADRLARQAAIARGWASDLMIS